MPLILFGSILPAVLLVLTGKSRYWQRGQPEGLKGWMVFLSGSLAIMLGAMLFLSRYQQESSLLTLLLFPSICALFAESLLLEILLIGAGLHKRTLPGLHLPAALLLALVLVFVGLSLWADRFMFLTILAGGFMLACGWLVWHRRGRWFWLSYCAVLLLMLAAVWATDTQSDFAYLPASLALMVRFLPWLAPGLGIVLAYRLLDWSMQTKEAVPGGRPWHAILMILPVLVLIAWQAATASAWDVATDGLGGIVMLLLGSIFGVAAALHQSWDAPRIRSAVYFGFVVLLLAVIAGANSLGTYGGAGEWGRVPHVQTEWRAALIDRAIQKYHARQGHYPESLAELTPGYILYLPAPFIIPGQDWCYQGGADYYRLGFVDRDYFSTPAFVNVFASAGQPSGVPWDCEAEAARYPGPAGYSPP